MNIFDLVPEYTGDAERVKNPRESEYTSTGILVSGQVVDPELLYKLALMGATNVELGDWFGVSESQIRFYFNEYLTKARTSLKIKLRRAQLKVAIENESVPMLIFLGKNLLSQADSPVSHSEQHQVLPWLSESDSDLSADSDAQSE